MSLFSKLFLREEDGEPGQSQQHGATLTGEDHAVDKSETERSALSDGSHASHARAPASDDHDSSASASETSLPTNGATRAPALEAPPAWRAIKPAARKTNEAPAMRAPEPPLPIGSTRAHTPAKPPPLPPRRTRVITDVELRLPTPHAHELATHDEPSLDNALDAALVALVDPNATALTSSTNDHPSDREALTTMFAELASAHAQPLRDLIGQLSTERTPRAWASACRPVVRPLLDAATQIGLFELVATLGAFDSALARAASEHDAFISAADVATLRYAYDRLHEGMPAAFGPADRGHEQQVVLLETLLLQVPQLRRHTLTKLYAAGVRSLSQLSQATPAELAAVTGLDVTFAHAIVDHVRHFEQRRSDKARSRSIRERLRSLVERLIAVQNEFEHADEEDNPARKKHARRARQTELLELDLLFAELGELTLLDELRRSPVRGKIRRVERYLEQLPPE